MPIENNIILKNIIEIQGCIIQGNKLKTILHKHRDFYIQNSEADVISICMKEHDKMFPEYVIEKHRLFAHLLHKYIFNKKTLSWDAFIKNHYQLFMSSHKYFKTDDIYEIFKGILTKREATSFNEELEMKHAVLMTIHDFSGKNIIGVICFLFRRDIEIDIKKLEEVKILFETLLQPLHDQQYNFTYTQCVRVDENFSLLTEQEKRITKKVLAGNPYNEIAELLNISINTLKTHMKNIFNKYNVNSKIELYNKLNSNNNRHI